MAPTIPNTVLLHLLQPRRTIAEGCVGKNSTDPLCEGDWRSRAEDEDFVLESWSEGCMVGALVIMACITVANMRKGVLLHKLILTELLLAMSHGTFCFMAFRGYGWYLSATAALLYSSWLIHNIVAWLKIRPFFMDATTIFRAKTGNRVRNIYLSTLACTVAPIILQIVNNFRFFNGLGDLYKDVRPDPWWIFTCLTLFHVIRKCYGTGFFELIKRAPRFGILLAAISLSLIFTCLDIAASIHNFIGTTDGINPWWKLSLVMKCLTDTIMLDDFKTELKRLGINRIQKEEQQRQHKFALAVTEKEAHDDTDELEYAKTLEYTNPALAKQRRNTLSPTSSSDSSPPRRMRQDSLFNDDDDEDDGKMDFATFMASTGPEHQPKRDQTKAPVAKQGMLISQLPGLKNFSFDGRRSKRNSHADHDTDPKDADNDVEGQNNAVRRKDHTHEDNDDDEPRMIRHHDRLSLMRQSLGIIDYRPETGPKDGDDEDVERRTHTAQRNDHTHEDDDGEPRMVRHHDRLSQMRQSLGIIDYKPET